MQHLFAYPIFPSLQTSKYKLRYTTSSSPCIFNQSKRAYPWVQTAEKSCLGKIVVRASLA